jgi:hypothetical protein
MRQSYLPLFGDQSSASQIDLLQTPYRGILDAHTTQHSIAASKEAR